MYTHPPKYQRIKLEVKGMDNKLHLPNVIAWRWSFPWNKKHKENPTRWSPGRKTSLDILISGTELTFSDKFL